MINKTTRRILIALAVIGATLLLVAAFVGLIVWFLLQPTQTPITAPPIVKDTTIAANKQGSPELLANDTPHPLDPLLQLAQDSLEKFRAEVSDYTAKLEKHERVAGKLADAQLMELKVVTRKAGDVSDGKLHVYLKFVKPASVAGREVIWVEGRDDENLVAHEGGFLNFMSVKLAPTSGFAMMGNKYPISQIGLERLLLKLIDKGTRDREFDDCKIETIEHFEWEKIDCQKIIIVHEQQRPEFDFHRVELILDTARKVPLSYSSYLWPKEAGGELPLEEHYAYHDLKLNVGLAQEDFNPDNPAYNYP